MKATVATVSPRGFTVHFESPDDQLAQLLAILPRIEASLAAAGYRPTASDWQRTPEGLPICPIHGEVMKKREKQGDVWYSHRLANGEQFCRGYGAPCREEPDDARQVRGSPNGRQ